MTDRAITILVIEDNPAARKLLRIALEAESYAVLEAADAATALSVAGNGLPDLILQDLLLPDMDGVELHHRLRELPGGGEVPILALSGFSGRFEEARTTGAGFTAVLVKPIEPNRLVEAVRNFLPTARGDEGSEGAGRHLLVVDDDPVQLKLARIHLVHRGYRVTTAASAADALAAGRADPPDAVVSDVLMPDADGFELCAELRRDPALAHVPVVLVSALFGAEADHALAARVGASALVARTHDLSEVLPAVRKAIASAPPPGPEKPTNAIQLEHARIVIRQLEQQVAANAGLALRCAVQAAQLSLLGSVADALTRRADSDDALREVLAATLDAAGISKGALFLRGLDGHLFPRHHVGFSDHQMQSLVARTELLAEMVARMNPVSIPSPAVPDDIAQAILAETKLASAQVVPLVSQSRGVGAIVLGARSSDVTSEDSIAFARAIGSQIVQSLELSDSFALLTASEERYRALLDNATDAIGVLTHDGVIREVNRRWETILGLPRDQIVGRRIHDFVAAEVEASEPDPGLFSTTGRTGPVELRTHTGDNVLIEFSLARLEVGGQRLVFAVGRDVTEQVRANTQLLMSDRMASLGVLAAGIAHEINNPLAAVTANLDLASRELALLAARVGNTVDLAELDNELRDAREAAERVRGLVRDLKVFSRHEDERRGPVDAHRVIDSTVRMAWNEIRHRARLVKDFGGIPLVLANEARLGQVFLNLVVNAAHAIAEGHADANEIRIRTHPIQGGSRVVIEVMDTGEGIPLDVMPKLFTPFFTTKPKGVGTGLGLAICQRVIADLGGEISVESEVGRGSVFRVTLPAARTVEPAVPKPPPASSANRRGRVMVVDDEKIVADAIRRMLMSEHDVTVVTRAQDALARLEGGERFDVILCDLMMPVMTGMELHAALVQAVPQQAERMVFLTGGAFTPRARAFLDGIPNRRLDKPFEMQALRALVNDRVK